MYFCIKKRKKKKEKEKRKKKKEKMSTPVFRMKSGAFIDRFLVGADRPLEAGANAWVKETVGARNDGPKRIRYGARSVGPERRNRAEYFYGTGHGRSIKTRAFCVGQRRRTAGVHVVGCVLRGGRLLRGRRIWVGMITAFDHRTGLVSVLASRPYRSSEARE